MFNIVTFPKVGAICHRPDWRFHMFQHPIAKLNTFRRPMPVNPSTTEVVPNPRSNTLHGSYLKRFVNPNDRTTYCNNCALSPQGVAIYRELNSEERDVFEHLQLLRLRSENRKRFTYTKKSDLSIHRWIWRVKQLENIKDEFIQKLIRYYTNVEFDEFIDYAISFRQSVSNEVLLRHIGYHIYLGIKDLDIAIKYRFKPKVIEALRYLFFDFSNAPKDGVANTAYLRQLVDNDIASDVDFDFYKLINEMGDVGLRSRLAPQTLSNLERTFIKQYLLNSALDNLFNLKMAIRTGKDAINWNKAISEHIRQDIAREGSKLINVKEENIKTSTECMKSRISSGSNNILDSDSESLGVVDHLYQSAIKSNPPPVIKSIEEIVKE
jgi:hypothetical protein